MTTQTGSISATASSEAYEKYDIEKVAINAVDGVVNRLNAWVSEAVEKSHLVITLPESVIIKRIKLLFLSVWRLLLWLGLFVCHEREYLFN